MNYIKLKQSDKTYPYYNNKKNNNYINNNVVQVVGRIPA